MSWCLSVKRRLVSSLAEGTVREAGGDLGMVWRAGLAALVSQLAIPYSSRLIGYSVDPTTSTKIQRFLQHSTTTTKVNFSEYKTVFLENTKPLKAGQYSSKPSYHDQLPPESTTPPKLGLTTARAADE